MVSDPRYHCRCDCQCVTFNDCCYDFLNQDLSCGDDNVTNSTDTSTYEECIAVPGSDISHNAYVLISKCPDVGPEADDREMCEKVRGLNDVIGLLPVYDSSTGTVYKNIFCAICHGLSVSDISQWRLWLNYDPVSGSGGGYINPSLLISIMGEVIGFEVSPTGAAAQQTRRCPFDVIETCSSTAIVDGVNQMVHAAENCSAYYAPVIFNNTLFRNPHCAMCNGVEIPATQYCDNCLDECPSLNPFQPCNISSKSCQTDNTESIDVLFSLDAFFAGVYGQSEAVTCSTGEVYDPFLRQCMSIPCTPLYNDTNVMCDHSQTTTTYVSTSSPSTTTSPTMTTITTSILHPSLQCLLRVLSFVLNLIGLVDVSITPQSSPQDLLSTQNAFTCSEEVMTVNLIFKEYDYALPFIDTIDASLASLASDTMVTNDSCPVCYVQTIKIFLEERRKEALSNFCLSYFVTSSNAIDDDSNSGLLSLATYDLTNGVVTRTPDVCLLENQQTCVTTKLNSSEYRLISNSNGSLVLLKSNITLSKEDYVMRSMGQVEICASLLLQDWPFGSVFEIALIACTGLSVIALLVTFVIYSARAELRDINGKCQLNMMAALIVGLLLSRFADFFLFNTIGCTVVAAVAHFVWLGAFCWLALFAIVVAIGSDDSQRNLFCRLFFFGWITPAIAIGLSLWLHFCQCRGMMLSYGRELHCLLQGDEALLFALAVPIAVILLVSIVAFLCGALRLRKVRQFVTAYSEEITEYTVTDALIYAGVSLFRLIRGKQTLSFIQ